MVLCHCRPFRFTLGRKQIGYVHAESGCDPVQRFQRGIGFRNLQRADKGLTYVRFVGEVMLRP